MAPVVDDMFKKVNQIEHMAAAQSALETPIKKRSAATKPKAAAKKPKVAPEVEADASDADKETEQVLVVS